MQTQMKTGGGEGQSFYKKSKDCFTPIVGKEICHSNRLKWYV